MCIFHLELPGVWRKRIIYVRLHEVEKDGRAVYQEFNQHYESTDNLQQATLLTLQALNNLSLTYQYSGGVPAFAAKFNDLLLDLRDAGKPLDPVLAKAMLINMIKDTNYTAIADNYANQANATTDTILGELDSKYRRLQNSGPTTGGGSSGNSRGRRGRRGAHSSSTQGNTNQGNGQNGGQTGGQGRGNGGNQNSGRGGRGGRGRGRSGNGTQGNHHGTNTNDNWVPKEVWQQLTPAQRQAIKSIQSTPRTQANQLRQAPPEPQNETENNQDDQNTDTHRNGSSMQTTNPTSDNPIQPTRGTQFVEPPVPVLRGMFPGQRAPRRSNTARTVYTNHLNTPTTGPAIVDAGADTTLMGDAFEVLSHSTRTVEVHGYNGARGAERGLYIATGVTMVDLPDGTALMLQFNEAVDMGSGKSLISSNQVRHHNNSVYDTPKRYGGLQCIVLGDWFNTIVPLEYKDGLCLMNIRKPTKWELANKQPTHVTCSLPWNPSITESDIIDPQDLVNHAAEHHAQQDGGGAG